MKEKEKEYECIKTFFDSYGMVNSYELLKGEEKIRLSRSELKTALNNKELTVSNLDLNKKEDTNIKAYDKYIRKYNMLGISAPFEFLVSRETDEISITKYIENSEEYRVIEIPSFVTGIRVDDMSVITGSIFRGVKQSLKVIHKDNKIRRMKFLFSSFCGDKLDLTEFDTTGVENMSDMFSLIKLKGIDLSNFDTSKVEDMSFMFNSCRYLEEIDISSFDTSKVERMDYMFDNCRKLTNINFGNMNVKQVLDMSSMFMCCVNLRELDLSKWNINDEVNLVAMFDYCKHLAGINTDNKDLVREYEYRKEW